MNKSSFETNNNNKKQYDNFRQSRTALKNRHIGQKKYSYVTGTCTNKKNILVSDHMTHVVRIGILSGHKEIGNLHFNPKIIFIAYLSKTQHAFSQNL